MHSHSPKLYTWLCIGRVTAYFAGHGMQNRKFAFFDFSLCCFKEVKFNIWSKCHYNFSSLKKYDLLKSVVTGCMIYVNISEWNSIPNNFLKNVGLCRACLLDSISQLDHACIIIEVILLGPGEHCMLSVSFWTFACFPRSLTQTWWWLMSLLRACIFFIGVMESTPELLMNK